MNASRAVQVRRRFLLLPPAQSRSMLHLDLFSLFNRLPRLSSHGLDSPCPLRIAARSVPGRTDEAREVGRVSQDGETEGRRGGEREGGQDRVSGTARRFLEDKQGLGTLA